MIRKITYLVSFVLVLSVILNFTYNSPTSNKYKTARIVAFTGEEPRNPNSIPYSGNINAENIHRQYTTTFSDSIEAITDVYMGESSIYDLQSNAVTQQLMQRGMDTLHAIFMQNLTPGLPGADRHTIYLISVDGGATWTTLGVVGTSTTIPSGFKTL